MKKKLIGSGSLIELYPIATIQMSLDTLFGRGFTAVLQNKKKNLPLATVPATTATPATPATTVPATTTTSATGKLLVDTKNWAFFYKQGEKKVLKWKVPDDNNTLRKHIFNSEPVIEEIQEYKKNLKGSILDSYKGGILKFIDCCIYFSQGDASWEKIKIDCESIEGKSFKENYNDPSDEFIHQEEINFLTKLQSEGGRKRVNQIRTKKSKKRANKKSIRLMKKNRKVKRSINKFSKNLSGGSPAVWKDLLKLSVLPSIPKTGGRKKSSKVYKPLGYKKANKLMKNIKKSIKKIRG